IEAPVVLEEQPARLRRMVDDLVDALPELRVRIRVVLRPNAPVARLPGSAAVVRAVHAPGRDRDRDPGFIGRVEEDGVERQAPAARLPLLPMRMPPQTRVQPPRRARVLRLEEGR